MTPKNSVGHDSPTTGPLVQWKTLFLQEGCGLGKCWRKALSPCIVVWLSPESEVCL